jgi:hypothetical protein
MATSPKVILIHAPDAPQHVGELKSILQRMKSDNRISGVDVFQVDNDVSSLPLKSVSDNSIVVVLTRDLEGSRGQLEKLLHEVDAERDAKLIEIIVDNLPYNNNFISLPADLIPIRARDDMNLVWNGIERNLEMLFPKPSASPQPVHVTLNPSRVFLKIAAASVVTFLISFLFLMVVIPKASDDVGVLVLLFSTLIPPIVYRIRKKELGNSDPDSGLRPLTGATLKRFILISSFALVILFISTIMWGIVLLGFLGLVSYDIAPVVLAALTTLFYLRISRKKSEATLRLMNK